MLAYDTGHIYVDEVEFGVCDKDRFEEILSRSRIVVQCPCMCHVIHEYANEDMLIVMMLRDVEDIVASEKRIEWKNGPYFELMNYGYSSRQAVSFRRRGGQVAPLKYAYWLTRQRKMVKHYVELEYESLSRHPLWILDEQRVDFAAEQTTL